MIEPICVHFACRVDVVRLAAKAVVLSLLSAVGLSFIPSYVTGPDVHERVLYVGTLAQQPTPADDDDDNDDSDALPQTW